MSLPNIAIKRLLIAHYGDDWLRGSEKCLIDTVKVALQNGVEVAVYCNSPILADALKSLSVPVTSEPMAILFGYHRPTCDIKAWWRQLRTGVSLITQFKPDVVHINSAAPAQWMTIACRFTGVPCVTQLHAHYGTLKDRLTLNIYASNHITGVSYAALRALQSDGTAKQRLSIIPNAIDSASLLQQPLVNLKAELGLSQQPLLISLGSLIARKGQRQLIEAISQLKHQGFEHHAAIIGSGPDLAALQEHARAYNVSDRIFFLGERSDAIGIMRGGADALICTSLDEVFGLVLAEANLAKIPVIAPNIVGINSVIKHRKTGWLYRANNVAALTQAIASLHTDPAWPARVAKGYYRATTVFASARQWQALLSCYQQVVATAQPPKLWMTLPLFWRGISNTLKRKCSAPLWRGKRYV